MKIQLPKSSDKEKVTKDLKYTEIVYFDLPAWLFSLHFVIILVIV